MNTPWLFYYLLTVCTLSLVALGLSMAYLFITKGRR